MITRDGLTYVSMTEAADIVGLSNDRLGRLLKHHLVPNGLRVFNTSKNNKGIQICENDLQLIVDTAVSNGLRIIDIILT